MKFTYAIPIAAALTILPAMAQPSTADQLRPANLEQDASLVRQAQDALNKAGFNPGQSNGTITPETQAALRKFQESNGLPATGHLEVKTLSALGIEVAADPGLEKDAQQKHAK